MWPKAINLFILSILLSLIAMAGYLYIYLGAFKKVDIHLVDKPPFHVVYKTHLGPYHKINSVIQSVEKWAQKHNLPCPETFGEYLDDPNQVPHDRLRSHGGCVMPKIRFTLPSDLYQRTVNAHSYIEARFSGSPAIGPFIVYPKIKKFAKNQHLTIQSKSFEIYQIYGANKITTRYLMPLSQK